MGPVSTIKHDKSSTGDIFHHIRDDDDYPDIDDTFKRSGPHNLNRAGYDEDSEY